MYHKNYHANRSEPSLLPDEMINVSRPHLLSKKTVITCSATQSLIDRDVCRV